MSELPVMKLYFVNLLACFFSCPYSVVLLGMPLEVQHVDQLASELQQSARDTDQWVRVQA